MRTSSLAKIAAVASRASWCSPPARTRRRTASTGLNGGTSGAERQQQQDLQDRLPGRPVRRQPAAGYQRGQLGNLAVNQANAKGNLGFKLEVLMSDDGGDRRQVAGRGRDADQDPAVLGVIGPIFSGPTSAVGKTYDAAGMALISPSATNATLTSLRLHHLPPDRPDRRRRGHRRPRTTWPRSSRRSSSSTTRPSTARASRTSSHKGSRRRASPSPARAPRRTPRTTARSPRRSVSSGAQAIFYGGYDAAGRAVCQGAHAAANFTGLPIDR